MKRKALFHVIEVQNHHSSFGSRFRQKERERAREREREKERERERERVCHSSLSSGILCFFVRACKRMRGIKSIRENQRMREKFFAFFSLLLLVVVFK